VDDAAFLQEQRREGAAGGEELGELAGQRIGEMEADQRQDGAEASIAGGLAEAGEQIGDLPCRLSYVSYFNMLRSDDRFCTILRAIF
jgi:hypothetical protein